MNSGITTEEAKSIDIEELLKKLSADKKGLSASEAKDRLQKFLYGWLVPAIGWELALLVWGWALVEFVVTDFIKVPVFKRF